MSDLPEVFRPFNQPPVAIPMSQRTTHGPPIWSDQVVENIASDAGDYTVSLESQRARYFAVKFAVDRTITALLMVVALPLMLLIGLAILLLDGRPVFYRQTRVGKNGRAFRIWKFRTMCLDAESGTGAVWSSALDPRVTALGHWLRCSHLDELPQFFNVLVGDMNLIGPRPERPEFVRELVLALPCYRERIAVRPGITGLAQLHLGYDQSLTDVRRKVLLDLEYIRTNGLFQDAKILLVTIPYIAAKLIRKWKPGPRSLNNAQDPEIARLFAGELCSPVGRPDVASSDGLEPHVSRFANRPVESVCSS